MQTIVRVSLVACGLISGLLVTALPAAAQPAINESNIKSGAPKGGAPNGAKRAEPPPPAVPGARARADSVAPADRNAADLPPTEALFDSINRGDIVTARDAISRGADLDGTNLLGLTPLELSVDLGRNDISFLLLSLRGSAAGSVATRGPAEEASSAPPTPADRRRAQAEARKEALAEARQAKAQTAAAVRTAAPSPQAPALFAGNGGSAVPSAGFLGFDPHR